MAFLVGASAPAVQKLAVPVVCLLIAFLGYGSQYLFAVSPDLAPGPLSQSQKWLFNTLLACLWWTYFRACSVDPGRYTFPPEKSAETKNKPADDNSSQEDGGDGGGRNNHNNGKPRKRWCKKCRRPKPPRAHHCKTCGRCIPRMDHHCPWTSNCVSLQTFPHFVRFLVYTNLSLWYMLYLISARFLALWGNRLMPAYLGPTLAQLVWLTVFTFVAGITSLALGILLITTLKGWLFNTTMIEGWEIERHEAVLERRSGRDGEDSFWPDSRRDRAGDDVPVDALEFPYDIGLWSNLCAGMGTRNFLAWLWPFAEHPTVADNRDGKMTGVGWEYEENGLNDAEGLWAPPDPAKTRHTQVWRQRRREMDEERERFENEGRWARPEDQREAFRQRQQRDLRRWEGKILGELEELGDEEYDFVDEARAPRGGIVVDEGKQGWVNAEGEHLGDYGVDEDAEFDEPGDADVISDDGDDDDVPLGELVRRRKVTTTHERDDT
ncbi:putative Palmitoyltransferase PFA4 [Seiridium cardinale]|uniref:Palmitoyltransferase PFA4 n=1 Tax=Seiridium cardinale TaxID=138064 RepID=A0ABR2XNQ4_9PEZI